MTINLRKNDEILVKWKMDRESAHLLCDSLNYKLVVRGKKSRCEFVERRHLDEGKKT